MHSSLAYTLLLLLPLCPCQLSTFPAKYEYTNSPLGRRLLLGAANQQQEQDFLFTAFVSKPGSLLQQRCIHLRRHGYIHEVGLGIPLLSMPDPPTSGASFQPTIHDLLRPQTQQYPSKSRSPDEKPECTHFGIQIVVCREKTIGTVGWL